MVRSIPQLDALRDQWEALASRFQSPLLDHDWFLSCAEAFYRDGDLRIVTVHNGSELSAVAPLARESSESGPRLMLMGASKLYEPTGWLFSSEEALADLVERTLRVGEPMILQRVPAESPLCRALAAVPSRRAVTLAGGTSTSLVVPTTQAWDVYYASLSTHITSNLPRLQRKAERDLGPMRVAEFVPRPPDVEALLETVVKVEGSGWKGRQASSLSARRDLRDFFLRYCRRAAARQRLRVTTLSFGSEVAAVDLSIEAYKRVWQMKIGYDDRLGRYYPGLHLALATIRSAFERGMEAYEFLGSAAAWEERWLPVPHKYRLLAVYPVSVRGLAGACRDAVGIAWRRANRVLRPAVTGSTP